MTPTYKIKGAINLSEFPYTIEELRNACRNDMIVWKRHAVSRIEERDILQSEVIECINNGEIIEYYISDKPFASCLVLGLTYKKRTIHTVCSYADKQIYIITAYEPNNEKWESNFRTRKKC